MHAKFGRDEDPDWCGMRDWSGYCKTANHATPVTSHHAELDRDKGFDWHGMRDLSGIENSCAILDPLTKQVAPK